MTDHRAVDRQRMGAVNHSRQRADAEKRAPDSTSEAYLRLWLDEHISIGELKHLDKKAWKKAKKL